MVTARNHAPGYVRQDFDAVPTVSTVNSGVTINPGVIFTPRKPADSRMYEPRQVIDDVSGLPIQQRIANTLHEEGSQILLYGETGVGKTSLLTNTAKQEGVRYITHSCKRTEDFDGAMRSALTQIVDFTEESRTEKESHARGSEAAVGSSNIFLTIKGTFKREFGAEKTFTAVSKSPEDTLLSAMKDAGIKMLVLENYQNASSADFADRTRDLLERLTEEEYSPHVKLAIVGIADSPTNLLASSKSVGRRTVQVAVPRMSGIETSRIAARGFNILGISCPEEYVLKISNNSDGYPYITHLTGLHIARHARLSENQVVNQTYLKGVKSAVAEDLGTLQAWYKSSIEITQGLRGREFILLTMSMSEKTEWTFQDVVDSWKIKNGERDSTNFLQVALGRLAKNNYSDSATGESFEPILVRLGTDKRYSYKFRDPQMRAFLRMKEGSVD